MYAQPQGHQPSRLHRTPSECASAVVLLLALALVSATSHAQGRDRPGKEVVDAVCAPCHVAGANGASKVDANAAKNAPKIGDKGAWAKRASQGLTSLTEHALKGIRNMPAHGGNAGTSDIEIERAITYMVNQSGGDWIVPLDRASPAVRSSEYIVRAQCAKCHEPGSDGAPKIGDRAAWLPRMKAGLEALVASAIHGHGAMPARGGLADLSDAEIRGAISYMFNFGVVLPKPAAQAPARADDAYHKAVAGTEVYLGMMPAEAIRASSRKHQALREMHGGLPSGKDYYHLNISLADSATQLSIADAKVTAKVSDSIGAESKALEPMVENNTTSYGNYFRLRSGSLYHITAQIRRPGGSDLVEATFDFKTR